MRKRFLLSLVLVLCLLSVPLSALAQSYSFSLDQMLVDVYYNADGTASIHYALTFSNDPFGAPIDFVDLGLPNNNFDAGTITAFVNGQPVNFISRADYQGNGTGVAVGLESLSIQPGETGTVEVLVQTQRKVLYPDSQDNQYASAVFSPTWFDSDFVHGATDISVTFHLPPGVEPQEPRWHKAPSGFPSEPVTGIDDQGRVTYTWSNPNASGDQQYSFGASFPNRVVPAGAITTPTIWQRLGINPDDFFGGLFCCGFWLVIGAVIFWSVRSTRKRKLQYLSPKIAIEGHGVKRGLTAIEAAILLEQPLDKILTMILFATVKKDAAEVVSRDPLEVKVIEPQPENLRPYEKDFLEAFKTKNNATRRKKLQDMMIDLVESVSNKMKGFSRRETVDYYRDIVKRAWTQVETAETPEVKSERYNDVMEWTMLDRDYEDRTRDVFRSGPVFVPMWWPRYDPSYGRGPTTSAPSMPSSKGGGSMGGGVQLPHLPGSDFAASMVNSVQAMSAGVIGNLSEFTGGVTNKTNPVPVSTSSGGRSSGGGCACACACAGCACACAGGGR